MCDRRTGLAEASAAKSVAANSGSNGQLIINLQRFAENNTEELPDDTLVVRGGQNSPENLSANQAKDPRGHISANVGSSLDTLATSPKPFPNGGISVTTAEDIRGLGKGWNVVPDPTASNPFHGSIVPPLSPLSSENASALSRLFGVVMKNVWR